MANGHSIGIGLLSGPTVDDDSVHQVVDKMPLILAMPFRPLCLEDWRGTMRGSDGWSVQELCWLSDDFTSLLLDIFQVAETFQVWPQQLASWILVLLRKTDDVTPTWSLV